MTHFAHLLTPLAALACAACVYDSAPVDEPVAGLSSERACFFASQVNGYGQAPDGQRGERIYVNTGVRERFLLETIGSCNELDWSQAIGIDPRYQSSICTGDTVDLIVPRGIDGRPDRCTARVLGVMLEDAPE